MDYRIAVCDDDITQSAYLKNLVLLWANEAAVDVSVTEYHSAESLLFHDDNTYSIYLLDIEMPGINGIELAQTIRRRSETSVIIFVSGYAEYIAVGYDVSALHYLLKPIDKPKLFSVLDKALKQLGQSEATLLIEQHGETHRVPLREIRYIEVVGNYVTIHAAQDIKLKKTLSELKKQLDDRFEPTGRSFIVNLRFVRRVTKTEVFLSSGETVPLSRGVFETLNRAIIERT